MTTFRSKPFDPKADSTIRAVAREIREWQNDDSAEGKWYVGWDDSGPSVIAQFSFNYHAHDFVRRSGEDMYVCDENGAPDLE